MRHEDLLLAAVVVLALVTYQRWLTVRCYLRLINYHAGYRSAFKKTSIWPSFFGLSPEKAVTWKEKHQLFLRFGWDIVSAVSWFPYPSLAFFVADPIAVKEVTLRWKFPKDVEEYKIFAIFGENLVSAEGDLWKRHRKICSPAYSERTNRFVWQETCRILLTVFAEWGHQHNCENVAEFTRIFSLKVISITGFGIQYDSSPGPGHRMPFGEAFTVFTKDGFLKLVVPEWAMCLTPRLRRTRMAFGEFKKYISQLIEDHRHGEMKHPGIEERDDLFSALLRANEAADEGGGHLNDEELFGNIFIGFFAGHETTAMTLAFILILLARHPEEQERLYSHIISVLKTRGAPDYFDMNLYSHTTAVINETLRMYPPVTGFPKKCTEDTTLSCASACSTEERVNIPVPKGSTVVIDVPGLHYNAKYWKNPYKWDPSRYHTEWNTDAFIPFSVGSRACIGRRFFETETTAMITMLVAHYQVELAPFSHSGDIAVQPALTLAPNGVPLIFRRRTNSSGVVDLSTG